MEKATAAWAQAQAGGPQIGKPPPPGVGLEAAREGALVATWRQRG